jgi:hypothetical protein
VIARPSARQLLITVRTELQTSVRAVIADDDVLARLDMIDSILASVILRADDEAAWIREEIIAITGAAEAVIAEGADADGDVAEALGTLRSHPARGDRLPDLHDEYNLAGEVLSRAIEAGSRSGGALRATVEGVLEDRLRREVLIRGDFSLAGRI